MWHDNVLDLIGNTPLLRLGLLRSGWSANDAVVVSLAPVLTLARLSEMLGGFGRLARVLPNAPSLVGAGFNPVAFAEGLPADARREVEALLDGLGEHPVVPERTLEAYAVIAAMGPTYFWFQWHALRELAGSFGLPEDLVALLRRGSQRLLDQHMQVGLEALLGCLQVLGSRNGNHRAIHLLVPQHLFNAAICLGHQITPGDLLPGAAVGVAHGRQAHTLHLGKHAHMVAAHPAHADHCQHHGYRRTHVSARQSPRAMRRRRQVYGRSRMLRRMTARSTIPSGYAGRPQTEETLWTTSC